jgi:hypothetical protein
MRFLLCRPRHPHTHPHNTLTRTLSSHTPRSELPVSSGVDGGGGGGGSAGPPAPGAAICGAFPPSLAAQGERRRGRRDRGHGGEDREEIAEEDGVAPSEKPGSARPGVLAAAACGARADAASAKERASCRRPSASERKLGLGPPSQPASRPRSTARPPFFQSTINHPGRARTQAQMLRARDLLLALVAVAALCAGGERTAWFFFFSLGRGLFPLSSPIFFFKGAREAVSARMPAPDPPGPT